MSAPTVKPFIKKTFPFYLWSITPIPGGFMLEISGADNGFIVLAPVVIINGLYGNLYKPKRGLKMFDWLRDWLKEYWFIEIRVLYLVIGLILGAYFF